MAYCLKSKVNEALESGTVDKAVDILRNAGLTVTRHTNPDGSLGGWIAGESILRNVTTDSECIIIQAKLENCELKNAKVYNARIYNSKIYDSEITGSNKVNISYSKISNSVIKGGDINSSIIEKSTITGNSKIIGCKIAGKILKSVIATQNQQLENIFQNPGTSKPRELLIKNQRRWS
ncbi:MAG: hypothetical protein ACP5TJ_00415 [Candidatus Micrarchaeia archaeon]